MTPQEKAKELFDKSIKELDHIDAYWDVEKDVKTICLLFCDEIIKELHFSDADYNLIERIDYYNEVKQEILSL